MSHFKQRGDIELKSLECDRATLDIDDVKVLHFSGSVSPRVLAAPCCRKQMWPSRR